MTRKPTKTNNQFCLMLQGRILLRDRDGKISDVTHEDHWGMKYFAGNAKLAIYIISQLKKRLDLLFLAVEDRSQIDAGLVRLAIEDIRNDLEDGSELKGYLRLTQMMFAHSKALSPLPIPDTPSTGRSL